MAVKVPETDVGSGHQPTGKKWICRDCGAFWPCEPARERLDREFARDRVVLNLYLASSFLRASQDMPDVPAGLLYGRFLGWVR